MAIKYSYLKPEMYYVESVEQAKLVLATLSIHDLNLGENIIESNISCLEVYVGEEWEEWYDEDEDTVNSDAEFDMLTGRE